MVGQHHQLNGHEFEQTQGDTEGQGSLVCCSSWDHKELDMIQQLNNTNAYIPLLLNLPLTTPHPTPLSKWNFVFHQKHRVSFRGKKPGLPGKQCRMCGCSPGCTSSSCLGLHQNSRCVLVWHSSSQCDLEQLALPLTMFSHEYNYLQVYIQLQPFKIFNLINSRANDKLESHEKRVCQRRLRVKKMEFSIWRKRQPLCLLSAG